MTQHEFPDYCLVEQLYSGIRTLVYRAIRNTDQQAVVIKLLKNEHPSFSELVQFRNQYTITKNLQIPGIIQPYSLEPYRNGYALIMEDLDGVSLRAWMKQRVRGGGGWGLGVGGAGEVVLSAFAALSASSASSAPSVLFDFFSIALQLTDTLHLLHQQRVIHKDIKPSNILIHPDSHQVKLLDFSISTLLPRETQESQNSAVPEGTLAYLSPEQTGRMNRGIDYRSDFYSLGITFYELLAGQLPFQSDDPMELVHCHLAKYPPAIHSLNPLVPPILSDLIAKLMAKNAEDRYQSALGLKFDLERCLAQYQETGKIEPFTLGDRDRSDRFTIPEKLYGREQEVAALLAAFERVAGNGWQADEMDQPDRPSASSVPKSAAELMLVAGFSGIGKTAVVNEVHKPIARQRGYFIKGKFDQFQRNIPFSALVQAFRHLMAQLLSESDTQLAQWRTHILAALGETAQIIIEVVPELEQILGPQPTVPSLSGSAAQHRFNLLFQKFIQVFTTADHPLVVFIDDLQWADSASLSLIKLLMSEAETGYLLLLGAYRDNEVFAAHPLMLTLADIRQAGAIVNTLTLAPLSADQVNHLVAETLSCTQALALPLTTLVYQKTQGNPFFTNQFLKVLHEDGLITFDYTLGSWQCDLAQVRSLALTDNVVEFMALQLQKLPVATQTMLKLAACIGAQFDLETLAIVSEQPTVQVALALWQALQEGLLLPINEVYKFYQAPDLGAPAADQPGNCVYRFLHDRVQQAAYLLIPDDQKQATHLKIGQLLLQNTPPAAIDLNVFDIVNQLNQGIDYLTQPTERNELAALNLVAGKKAKTSTAYQAAAKYLSLGIELLDADCWQHHYPLTIALHRDCAECAYLIGNFERAEALFEFALNRTQNVFDQVDLYTLLMTLRLTQGEKLAASVATGLEGLKTLGIVLPDRADALQALTQSELAKMQTKLATMPLEELLQQPTMSDPTQKACMKLMAVLWSAACVISDGELSFLVSLLMLNLSLNNGATESSGFAYCVYGMSLAHEGDYQKAYEFGQLALALDRQVEATPFIAKNNNHFCHAINPYARPLKTNLPLYQESWQICQETGDLVFGVWAVVFIIWTLLIQGDSLNEVYAETEKYLSYVERVNDQTMLYAFTLQRQFLRHLQVPTEATDLLHPETENQPTPYVEVWRQKQVTYGLNWYGLLKLQLLYLYGRYAEAIETVGEIEQTLGGAADFFPIVQYHFYYPLSLTALYDTAPAEVQTQYDRLLQQHQQRLQQQADACPANFLHRYLLLSAEMARLAGNFVAAIDGYDRAIVAAKANVFLSEEALANELAAKFYHNWGKERIAQEYMTKAYYGYVRWGAKAKIDDLEQHYPQFLASILQQRQQTLTTTDTIFSPTSHSTHASTSSNVAAALDLATVLKVSQTLSGEIELEKLLAALLAVMLESAGAEKCVLMLLDNDASGQPDSDRLLIKGFMRTGAAPIVLQRLPIEDSQEIPLQLIYRVKHSLQAVVVLDAAADPTLATDLYTLRVQPKSVLCSPILRRGKFAGILYLENNLVTGAFTSDRVELLNLLCAQAAISLENARLYERSQTYAQQLETSLEDLQRHKTRFQNLAANLPGMLYQFRLEPDGSHSMPYVSSGCYDLYEVEPAAVMAGAQSLHAMQHPDDQVALLMAIGHSAQTLTPLEQEFRIVTRSGEEKWVQAIARPQLQPDKAIVWDGVLIDISDRKRSEAERKQAEKTLKLTQFAVDHASVPIWWVKPNGHLTYANAAACRELGYTQSEMLQKHVWDFNPDFVSEAWDRHWQELKAKGSLSFKTYNINQAGQRYPVEVTVNYLELDGEEYNCAFVKNISDRKRAEAEREAAQAAQARLITILESTTDIVGMADAAGNNMYLNKAGQQVLGIPAEEMNQFHIGEVTASAMLELMQTVALPTAMQTGSWSGESALLTRNNEEIPISQVMVAHKNQQGEVEFFSTIMRDIRDRKRAEATLQISEQNLRTIFNNVNSAIFLHDLEGNVLDVNDRALELYDIQPTQVQTISVVNDCSAPDNPFHLIPGFWAEALAGNTVNFEWKASTPAHDRIFDVDITLTRIVLDGEAVILASVLDISERQAALRERQRAEAQLNQRTVELEQTLQELQRTQTQMVQAEKMSGLGQLVAGVAHEINNPVNFIYGNLNHADSYTQDLLGLVQLYQQHYPTPHPAIQQEAEAIDLDFLTVDLPKLLNSMKVGADRIQKIVASLRNFSRMDEAEMKEVNIHDGIDSTLMILQHRLKAKADHPGIEIIKVYGNLPPVECYAGQLNQVLMNLLSNAIDALEEAFTARTNTIATITIQTIVVNAQQIAIHITDNGLGVPATVQPQLFNPFFTTKPVGKGTGMGLSISYQIVTEKHKGTLQCVSKPGQGATFIITIPIRQA